MELVPPALSTAHRLVTPAVAALYHSPESLQKALPAARELLSCPELVPFLAIALLVAVLWCDTGSEGGVSGGDSTRMHTSGSVNIRSLSSPHATTQTTPTRGTSQPAVFATSSTAGRYNAGSGSTSRTSSSGRLANGISLDSLTPLSRGLFSLLGVEQGVLLQAGGGAATWGTCSPNVLENLVRVYGNELLLRVSNLLR